MISGVENKTYPLVLEDDRECLAGEQTIFHIKPKTGHDANKSLQRYAAASRDGRGGRRELNVSRLNTADLEEFLTVCKKVENYIFPSQSKFSLKGKPTAVIESREELEEVARTLSADHLAEIFEAANNMSKLSDSSKKDSSS